MDIKCYHNDISRYKKELNLIEDALDSLDKAASTLWDELSVHAKGYAGVFEDAASPNNVGPVCYEMTSCYDTPKSNLEQEIEDLKDVQNTMNETLADMEKADAMFHANSDNGKNNREDKPVPRQASFMYDILD